MRANVIPLFKGKGEQFEASSYRPIGLRSCFAKILEKIVKVQLQQHIDQVSPLSLSQHGFCAESSTLTNLLVCGNIIADYVNAGIPSIF